MRTIDIILVIMFAAVTGLFVYQQQKLETKLFNWQAENSEKYGVLQMGLSDLKTQLQAIDVETPVVQPVKDDITGVFEMNQDSESLNAVKQRFEGLFVNYQYLRRCGELEADDYHILNSALMHELASNNAPARLQYDILTASNGTYEEIYARSECDAASVQSIQQNFRDYINEARKIRFVIQD